MKHIEEVPWWICDEDDINYCAYSDTDSVYLCAEPLLRYLHPNFDEMASEEKDEELEKIALYYQDYITDSYDNLATDCFNIPSHRLEMKTECVIRSAYFRATRRYAQWITKQEGITKEKLDVKGLEFKKANFPPVLGKFFRQVLIDVVKTLNKYTGSKPKAGEMFTTMIKGAPVSAKAAAVYNDLIRFWGLNKDHSYIVQGDKIKYIYLKPNPYQIDALGFLSYDIPDKIVEFMEKYADRQKIFDSILLNKLEGFYSDLGWTLNLNPYQSVFFNFD